MSMLLTMVNLLPATEALQLGLTICVTDKGHGICLPGQCIILKSFSEKIILQQNNVFCHVKIKPRLNIYDGKIVLHLNTRDWFSIPYMKIDFRPFKNQHSPHKRLNG